MALTPRRKKTLPWRKGEPLTQRQLFQNGDVERNYHGTPKITSPGTALPQPNLLPALAPMKKPAGEAAPGAPKLGTTGTVNINGENHPVNASGIISSGPHKGRYPMQVINDDPIRKRAIDAVNTELNPQISQLDRKAQMEWEAANNLISQRHADTEAYSGSVGTLYDKLREQMGLGNQQVQQGWQQASTNTASAYDDLIASLSQNYGGGIKNTSDMADRLGLEAATPEATQQMRSDQDFLSKLFGGQKQSSLDFLTQNGLIDQSYGNRIQDAASATGLQFRTRAMEDYLRDANDIRTTASGAITEYRGQAGDLEATRGGRIRENIAALEDARAQAQSEAEAAQFDRAILLEKLELQKQELGIDAEYKAGQLDIDRQKLGLDAERIKIEARKTDAQLKKELRELTPGTLEYEEKKAAIDLKKSQTKKNIHEYTKAPDPAKFGKGRVGAQSYLSSLGDPGLVQAGMHEVTLAMQYGKDYPDAVRFMRNNFSKFSDLKDPKIQAALLNALDLAWEGPKTPRKE